MSHKPALLLVYACLVIFWLEIAWLFVRNFRNRGRRW